MFRGRYQFVEVEIEPHLPHHGAGRIIHARTLDEKTAANPDTVVGVIVDLDNEIDRILVMGDDAYTMGKMPMELGNGTAESNRSHRWCGSEGYGRYYGYAKPEGTAKIIMDMIDVKEK